MKNFNLVHGLTGWLVISAIHAMAAEPQWMVYQGVLQDAGRDSMGSGTPASYTMRFSMYTVPTGGSPVWSEEQTVMVDEGHYSVFLGSGSPLISPQPTLYELFRGGGSHYLDLQVSLNSVFENILPRHQIAAMPFAMQAEGARRLINSQGEALTQADGNAVVVDGEARVAGPLHVTALQANGSGLTALNANHFASGNVPADRLPNLPASKITSGTFAVPLVAEAFSAGPAFSADRIPSLPASQFSFGTIPSGSIPNLPASKISGTIPESQMPDLSASKFTSGVLPISRGGTGQSSLLNGRVLITDRWGGLTTTWTINWDVRSGYEGLRVYSPQGHIWTDFPGGWRGIATWDITVQSALVRSWQKRSDARLKTNVVALAGHGVLNRVLSLRPVTFEWIDGTAETQFGFIAQEVRAVLPELVSQSDDGVGMLAIRDDEMLTLLVQAMQEQQALIEAQHAEWQSLTLQMDELDAELMELLDRAEQVLAEGGRP